MTNANADMVLDLVTVLVLIFFPALATVATPPPHNRWLAVYLRVVVLSVCAGVLVGLGTYALLFVPYILEEQRYASGSRAAAEFTRGFFTTPQFWGIFLIVGCVISFPIVIAEKRLTLAALCFRLAEAFDAASRETPKVKAALEAASKAAVKLDEVDLSHVFQPGAKT